VASPGKFFPRKTAARCRPSRQASNNPSCGIRLIIAAVTSSNAEPWRAKRRREAPDSWVGPQRRAIVALPSRRAVGAKNAPRDRRWNGQDSPVRLLRAAALPSILGLACSMLYGLHCWLHNDHQACAGPRYTTTGLPSPSRVLGLGAIFPGRAPFTRPRLPCGWESPQWRYGTMRLLLRPSPRAYSYYEPSFHSPWRAADGELTRNARDESYLRNWQSENPV